MTRGHEKMFRRVLGNLYKRPGWRWEPTKNGHIRGVYVNGKTCYSGCTPSDQRGARNLLARIKRIERETDG